MNIKLLILAVLVALSLSSGCSRIKCEIEYEICIDKCEEDSVACQLGCKMERKWCEF